VNTAPYVDTLGRAESQGTARATAAWAGPGSRIGDALNRPLDGWGSGPALVSGDADSSVLAMDWTLEAQGQLLSRPQRRQSGMRR
jgi:hypothetical protein